MRRRTVRRNSRWQWLGPFVFAGLGVVVAIGAAKLFDPPYVMTTGDYVLAALLGFLLGLVVLGSLRGHGYVRGDGEPGSKPEVPVGEERGFYWRT